MESVRVRVRAEIRIGENMSFYGAQDDAGAQNDTAKIKNWC
jgi:hypothetical protein